MVLTSVVEALGRWGGRLDCPALVPESALRLSCRLRTKGGSAALAATLLSGAFGLKLTAAPATVPCFVAPGARAANLMAPHAVDDHYLAGLASHGVAPLKLTGHSTGSTLSSAADRGTRRSPPGQRYPAGQNQASKTPPHVGQCALPSSSTQITPMSGRGRSGSSIGKVCCARSSFSG